MKMLTKTKNAEERKNHAETVLALTKSLKSYSDTMSNINDRISDLDEDLEFMEDFMWKALGPENLFRLDIKTLKEKQVQCIFYFWSQTPYIGCHL